jgi:homoserine kinase type II
MEVYLLQHSYEHNDDEEVKVIGVYSSEMAARAAIKRLKEQPGFRNYPDGFHVDHYQLDKDHWTEGFVDASDA